MSESITLPKTGKDDEIATRQNDFILRLNAYDDCIKLALEKLTDEKIVTRIWKHDHTVWKPDPTEITNRLGWLHSPRVMMDGVADIEKFVGQLRSEGFTQVLLLGMGGSSLSPEVFRLIFGVKQGYLDLAVLDSTHPEAVLSYAKNLNPEKTLFIASTKSGGTVETLSFMKYFYNQTLNKVGSEKVGDHFVAITDPGSGLESLAKTLKFRKIFLNDPNIGGRYSALSYFGLVPAGLVGVDLQKLLDRAQTMAGRTEDFQGSVNGDNSGVVLGAVLGELARQGRDKLTFIISPAIEPFGDWVEQLIAESTGKEKAGILPVVRETVLPPESYANDRLFVYLKLENDTANDEQVKMLRDHGHPVVEIKMKDKYDLGSEFFRWEIATVIAGYFLNINPFDQPNVEAAKVLAKKMVAAYQQNGKLPEPEPAFKTENVTVFADEPVSGLTNAFQKFFAQLDRRQNGDIRPYVAIQAFVKPGEQTHEALQNLRTRIQKKFKVATTVGYGPRFLHSTGQLHKGDAGNGLFIQITDDASVDVPIPDHAGNNASSMTFGVLILAQALGDRQALIDAHRKVIRFHLSGEVIPGIQQLTGAI